MRLQPSKMHSHNHLSHSNFFPLPPRRSQGRLGRNTVGPAVAPPSPLCQPRRRLSESPRIRAAARTAAAGPFPLPLFLPCAFSLSSANVEAPSMVAGVAVPASGRADPCASWPDPVVSGRIWWLPSSPAHNSSSGWDAVVTGRGCLGALLLSPLLLRLRLGQRWRGDVVVRRSGWWWL
jgi:hypothetical protein